MRDAYLRANILLWRNVIEVEAVLDNAEAPSHDDAEMALFVNMQLRPGEKVLWSGRVNRSATLFYKSCAFAVLVTVGLIVMYGFELIFGRHVFRDNSPVSLLYQLLFWLVLMIVNRIFGPIYPKDAIFAITDQRILSVFPTGFLLLISPSGVPSKAERLWASRIAFTNPSIKKDQLGRRFRGIYFTVHDPDRVLRIANEAIEKARLRAASQ